MKIIKKLSAVILYLFVITVLLRFKLQRLIDVKQIMLLLLGAVLIYLPGLSLRPKLYIDWETLGKTGLFAGVIQTFILLFILLSNTDSIDRLLYDATLACRPLLYGFCLYIILDGECESKGQQSDSKDIHAKDMENARRELTVDEYIDLLRDRGLSPREAEVAVQVNKGLSNAEIAERLCITETTVKKHLSNIFAKLQITRREQIRKLFDEE